MEWKQGVAQHVLDEARRCLNCKNPQCQTGCPIHTPTQAFCPPKSILDEFEHRDLILHRIKVRPNTAIGAVIAIGNLLRDGYQAILIGAIVW